MTIATDYGLYKVYSVRLTYQSAAVSIWSPLD